MAAHHSTDPSIAAPSVAISNASVLTAPDIVQLEDQDQLPTFKNFKVEELNPVSFPQDHEDKSFLSFGKNGTVAIINRYGGILNITKSQPEKASSSERAQRICLDASELTYTSPTGMKRRQKFLQLADEQSSGLGLCIRSKAEVGDPCISWVNARWPRIMYEVQGLKVSVQFVIIDESDVLLQQCVVSNDLDEDKTLPLFLKLDDMEVSITQADIQNVDTGLLPYGSCPIEYDDVNNYLFIKNAGDPENDKDKGDAAEAMIYMFKDGEVANLKSPSDPLMEDDLIGVLYTNTRSERLLVSKGSIHEWTVAYKLQPKGEPRSTVLSYFDMGRFLKKEKKDEALISILGEDKQEFKTIFRQHLEHILCVCSMPEGPVSGGEQPLGFINGDVLYSHSTPFAPFFMFRYLLLAYKALEGSVDSDARERIKRTCRGHLIWCFNKYRFLDPETVLTHLPEKERKPLAEKSENWSDSFVGSLQILKLYEFSKTFQADGTFVKECLQNCAEKWIKLLLEGRDEKSKLWYQRKNTPTYIAWEGSDETPPEWLKIPSYRLGDSVYVWKAIKALEEMVHEAIEEDETMQVILEQLQSSDLAHQGIRNLIFKRFICEVPQPIKPENDEGHEASGLSTRYTVAVSRSASQEGDRFLFYAKDTLLHDGVLWGFFNNDFGIDIQSAWHETLKSQGADAESIWQTPLRYALAIIMEGIMKTSNSSLDENLTPEDLTKLSRKKISNCILPNGLFAERIDWNTKKPLIKMDYSNPRSTYEIPTLLLRADVVVSQSQIFSSEFTKEDQQNQASVAATSDIFLKDKNEKEAIIMQEKKKAMLRKRKKISNTIIDHKQVFDPSERKDRDWLRPFPDFFSRQPPYEDVTTEIGYLRERIDDYPLTILEKGMDTWEKFESKTSILDWHWYRSRCLVVDIGRHGRERPFRDTFNSRELDKHVRQPRTIKGAKKRFFYQTPLSPEYSLILYLSTPKRDQYNMAEFLSRHQKFDPHFHEDVHDISNVWNTELHLSFILLVPTNEEDYVMELDSSGPPRGFLGKSPLKIGGQRMNSFKASLSYRLVGDMEDRYWTGWLLAYLPNPSTPFPPPHPQHGAWFKASSKQDQRKVLEPYLVQIMATEVYSSTERILQAIDEWLDVKNSLNGGFDRLYTRSKLCLDLDGILNRIIRLSEANIKNLNQWLTREERRNCQPRWSEKDELKHGSWREQHNLRVKKNVKLLEEQAPRIEASIKQIQSHRLIIDNLNLAGSRTAARSAENVRIFTYATVVFLPLSFVSSIFSMQGLPSDGVIKTFIRGTAIALIITLVIVFNAETLAWPLQVIRFKMREAALKKMRETLNTWPIGWRKAVKIITKLEDDDILHADEPPKWQGNKMIYVFFWIVYTVVELPAIRVALGYQSLTGIFKSDSMGHFGLLIIRILLGLIFLPVVVIIWPVLVTWSIVSIFFLGFHKLERSLAKSKGEARAKKVLLLLDKLRKGDKTENEKDQNDAETKNERKDKVQTAQEWAEEKESKALDKEKKGLEYAEEKERAARDKEKRRLEKKISALLNPPELLMALTRRAEEAEAKEDTKKMNSYQEGKDDEDDEDDDTETNKKSESEIAYSDYIERHMQEKGDSTQADVATGHEKVHVWNFITSRLYKRKRTPHLEDGGHPSVTDNSDD